MFSKSFIQAIHNTWQAIGSDLLQSCDEMGEDLDNECAVEACIDADRIVTFGGDEGKSAQDEFRAKMHEIGYPAALKLACKSLPYPLM